MSKILITGGAGFIGFNTAKYYREEGHEVDVMDNLERSSLLGHEVGPQRLNFNMNLLKQMGVNFYRFDVSDKESFDWFDGHDVIIHLAGQAGVPTSIMNPRRDFEVNTLGTFNVLEYARKNNSTVVFSSTNKVYPIHDSFVLDSVKKRWEFNSPVWRRFGFPVNNVLVGARTPYGCSKYAADILCQEYAYTYGIRTGVFRLGCIWGPAQFGFEEQGWATYFIIAILKGWPITIYGDGCQVRDMLYVEDCVKAFDAFVTSKIHDGVWNLGGGLDNTLSLNEHLANIKKLTGREPKLSFEDWRPLDQKCYISDLTLVKRQLRWRPMISSVRALRQTLDWVQENIDVF